MESAALPWEKKISWALSRTILRPSPALARKASALKAGWVESDTRATSSRRGDRGLAIAYAACEGWKPGLRWDCSTTKEPPGHGTIWAMQFFGPSLPC